LFFGSIEFSRVNMLRHSVAEAAYEGARRGIVPGATATEVQSQSAAVLDSVKARSYTIAVSPTTLAADTPEVTVSVSLPLDQNSWVGGLYFGGKTMTKSFTMRREKYETATVP
jgi:Flp pilus assembly protein TadG